MGGRKQGSKWTWVLSRGAPAQAQQLWPRPQVPHGVHPFGDVLVVLDAGGTPFHHQKGGLEEQGHDQ